MSHHPISTTKEGPLRPRHFVVRPTGQVVPLIAVDELPPNCNLVGVPSSLDLESTIGMLNLGLQKGSGLFYQFVQQFSNSNHNSKITNGKPPSPSPTASPSSSPPSTFSSPTLLTTAANTSHDPINVPPPLQASPPPPSRPVALRHSNLPPGPPKTQLCRHWCTHGNCKWGQECHYKHVMPLTLAGLQEIGLGDWPAWYRLLNPGYFVGRSGQVYHQQFVGHPGAHYGHGYGYGYPMVTDGIPKKLGIGKGKGKLYVNGAMNAVLSSNGKGKGDIQQCQKKEAEMGKQIMEQLKELNLQREKQMAEKEKQKDNHNQIQRKNESAGVMLERGARRETRRWEDDTEEEDDFGGVRGQVNTVEKQGQLKNTELRKQGTLVDV